MLSRKKAALSSSWSCFLLSACTLGCAHNAAMSSLQAAIRQAAVSSAGGTTLESPVAVAVARALPFAALCQPGRTKASAARIVGEEGEDVVPVPRALPPGM